MALSPEQNAINEYIPVEIAQDVDPDAIKALVLPYEVDVKAEEKTWKRQHPFPLPSWSGSVTMDRAEAWVDRYRAHMHAFKERWWRDRGYRVTFSMSGSKYTGVSIELDTSGC